MEPLKSTRVEELLSMIASRQRVATDCRKEEKALASSRNEAEVAAKNAMIELAKQLRDDLGADAAAYLCNELVRVTGWQPSREVR